MEAPPRATSEPRYPPGTVRALLQSVHVTNATRTVLERRLQEEEGIVRFFDPVHFSTLRAVCTRLIPQHDRSHPIEVAAVIDARLADGLGNGWRYATMPPDGDTYRAGLDGIDDSAVAMFGVDFQELGDANQDVVLLAVQQGTAVGAIWEVLSGKRFFEELLAEAVEAYYSHPLAQEEIGYVGMADATGWHRIGLNALEEREPLSG